MKDIDSLIYSLNNGPDKFGLIDKVDINKCIGIKITQINRKQFKASQLFLIDCIISFLGFNPDKFDMKTFSMASLVGKGLLHKDFEGNPCKEQWSYCTNVGMLLYL